MKRFEDKKKFKVGVWNLDNIDTDIIIPSDYLKVVDKKGLREYLFDTFRFLDKGRLGLKAEQRQKNPDFFLNKEVYKNPKVLIVGDNFGCGSSREHAPWALIDFGIKAIISTSFAGIFYENSFKNGLLLINLNKEEIDELMEYYAENKNTEKEIFIDLENQKVKTGEKEYSFDINEVKKKSLLLGLDEIGLILQDYKQDIKDFEKKQKEEFSFLVK